VSPQLDNLADICSTLSPHAAIVVANNDFHPTIKSLAAVGVFRCAMVDCAGELVEALDVDEYTNVCMEQDQPMYILTTSGSTGTPKFVKGTQCGLRNRVEWGWESFPFDSNTEERVLRRTPLTFVDALAEIFCPLLCSTAHVALWVPSRDRMLTKGIDEDFSEVASRNQVSRITLVPSQLRVLLSVVPDMASVWPSLKVVFVSGEALPSTLVCSFSSSLPNCTLVNLYGSTEMAGDVTYIKMHPPTRAATTTTSTATLPGFSSRIGYVIDGNVLDIVVAASEGSGVNTFRRAKNLESGQLLMSGVHLALGYVTTPSGSTDTAFISDPTIDGEVHSGSYYLTGDIAYRDGDGCLQWLGRADNQVKIRGERVELEGIEEAVKSALDQPRQVVALHLNSMLVVVVETEEVDLDEATRACVVAASRTRVNLILARRHLPKTIAGKLDRKKLLRELEEASDASPEPASNGNSGTCSTKDAHYDARMIKNMICAVFKEVLHPPPDVQKLLNGCLGELTFTAVGGDSLAAIEAYSILVKRSSMYQSIGNAAMLLDTSLDELTRLVMPGSGSDSSLRLDSYHKPSNKRRRAASRTDEGTEVEVDADSVYWRSVGDVGTQALKVELCALKLGMCVDAPPLLHTDTCGAATNVFTVSHGGDIVRINLPSKQSNEALWTCYLQKSSLLEVPLRHVEGAPVLSRDGHILYVCSYAAVEFREDEVNDETQDHGIGTKGALWAIDAVSGLVRWVACAPDLCKGAPALCEYDWGDTVGLDTSADGVVIFGCYDGNCYIVSCTTGHVLGCVEVGGPLFAAPVIVRSMSSDGEFTLATSSTTGCINLTRCCVKSGDKGQCTLTSELIWTKNPQSPIFSTPAVIQDSLLVADVNGTVRCLNIFTGESVWETTFPRPVFSSPRLCPGTGTFVVGCHDGYVRCVDVSSGDTLWSHDLGCAIFSQPFVCGNGDIVVSTTAGGIHVLATDVERGGVKCIFRHLLPAECFSSPRVVEKPTRCIIVGARNECTYAFTFLQ
jgi:acyl-coenzyme A synthetase/AMP-(fatty) acid ligase/outer membrane protein assembly factor BamB